MNEITIKLIEAQKKDMAVFLEGLYAANYDARRMAAEIAKQVQIKEAEFYAKQEAENIKISRFIGESLDIIKDISEKKGDSKAERIFYKILEDSGIKFNFQYPIGPYKIDFLINKTIVFEGDGKQHRKSKGYDKKRDEYLTRLGYHVMRIEWSIVAMSPENVIEEIKIKLKELGI